MQMQCFNVDLAKQIGIEKAILLENFARLVEYNYENEKLTFNGATYIYYSYKALQKLFPYMKEATIKRIIREMEVDGIIEGRTDLATNKYDKTKYYTIKQTDLTIRFFQIVKKMTFDSQKNDDRSSKILQSMVKKITMENLGLRKGFSDKKVISLSLPKLMTYEQLSKLYKDRLKGIIFLRHNGYRYNEFIQSLVAKGYSYKNFYMAYKVWMRKYDDFIETNWKNYNIQIINDKEYRVFKIGNNIYAINEYDFEMLPIKKVNNTNLKQEETIIRKDYKEQLSNLTQRIKL